MNSAQVCIKISFSLKKFQIMLLHDVIRINIFRKSKEAIRDSYENTILLTLNILKISINFCVNEDWRLTKNFINRSVFSKQEVLVLSSSKSLSISYLFHI